LSLQKVKQIIPTLIFIFIILPFFSILFYRLSDENLTPQAVELLIHEGQSNQELRKNLENPKAIVVLPRDSLFDHQLHIKLVKDRFENFKVKLTKLNKTDSITLIMTQIDSSLKSLLSINPLTLLSYNLNILEFCLLELKNRAHPLTPELLQKIKEIDVKKLFMNAARFHAQCVLGSISTLKSSTLWVTPGILLIQKQRLLNQMASLSSGDAAVPAIQSQPTWYNPKQYEALYSQLFRQLLFDPKINLKLQLELVLKSLNN